MHLVVFVLENEMYNVALTLFLLELPNLFISIEHQHTFGYLVYILESIWDCVAWKYKWT